MLLLFALAFPLALALALALPLALVLALALARNADSGYPETQSNRDSESRANLRKFEDNRINHAGEPEKPRDSRESEGVPLSGGSL